MAISYSDPMDIPTVEEECFNDIHSTCVRQRNTTSSRGTSYHKFQKMNKNICAKVSNYKNVYYGSMQHSTHNRICVWNYEKVTKVNMKRIG